MEYKISKELFEAVIGNKYGFNFNSIDKEVYLEVYEIESGESLYDIHIDTFFFKCKDWALKKGYFIYSTHELAIIKTLSLENIEVFSNGKYNEKQCVFDACEYIRIGVDNGYN